MTLDVRKLRWPRRNYSDSVNVAPKPRRQFDGSAAVYGPLCRADVDLCEMNSAFYGELSKWPVVSVAFHIQVTN